MPTGTAFGPQGYGAATTLPPGSNTNRHGAGIDTWVQDCNASGGGSTILDAQFFNTLLGNIRTVVQEANAAGAGITMNDGDMTLLYEAIRFMVGDITVGQGLSITGTHITLDVPSLKAMVA